MPLHELGQSIPDTPHAISVSLPTWEAVVGYEEGQDWVLSKLKTGYPRFVVHSAIARFAEVLVESYGSPTEHAFLFPSNAVAERCGAFFTEQLPTLAVEKDLRILDLYPCFDMLNQTNESSTYDRVPFLSAVIFPRTHLAVGKTFWQHSGDGISSRRAEFCHQAFQDGLLSPTVNPRPSLELSVERNASLLKGPKRYQREQSINASQGRLQSPLNETSSLKNPIGMERREQVRFVEERFGRNLDMSLAMNAKLAIRRRIAGALTADVELEEALEMTESASPGRQVHGFSEHDVYLYPTGMSSIFNVHRVCMSCLGDLKSICFGFPYIDTLKILEKWGPGCLFYGNGSSEDLDDLEERCNRGEKYLALFCEFPGNPLLKSPDLKRLRSLAHRYGFAVVVDETIGNFMNVQVLPYADVVVSSLTKVFSGDSNVMGGSAVLNPKSPYYALLRERMLEDYEDNYWAEDAIFMERNSRNFVSRIERINLGAEAICNTLLTSPYVKEVYYPKHSPTRPFYDHCRTRNGGYGGLLSVTFHSTTDAVTFFDALETAKGPSLGTNFTISSPYIILAHYGELEWCAKYGVEADLVRISVGLEDATTLTSLCSRALMACENRQQTVVREDDLAERNGSNQSVR